MPLTLIARLGWALLLAGASAAAAAEAKVAVQDAWVRPTTVATTAAYMTLVASGAPSTLVGVSSPVGRAELHVTTEEGGIVRMRAVASLPIGPGQPVRLHPGGHHIMLLGLARPLRLGDAVRIALKFADGSELALDVPVRVQPPAN